MEDQPAVAGDLTETAPVSEQAGAGVPQGSSEPERGGSAAATTRPAASAARGGGLRRWSRRRGERGKPVDKGEDGPAAAVDDDEKPADKGEDGAPAPGEDGKPEEQDSTRARAHESVAELDKQTEPVDEAGPVDKQAGASGEAAGVSDETTEAGDEAADGAEEGAGEENAGEESAGEESAGAEGENVAVARKPVGRLLAAAVAAAAAVFVGAGAFAGAMTQPYLADRALVNTKLDIAHTAANAITTLWTYTPEDMDKLPDRAAKYLTGDFENQYRKYIDAIATVNKQAKVTNNTQVVGAAVESLNGPDATAVVYTNTSNISPQSNNIPSMLYVSYRLTLERHDSRWLITKMTPITTINLTPRLG